MSRLNFATIFQRASPYQVKLLFGQLTQTSIVSAIAAIIVTVVLWPVASHFWLVAWLSFICITAIARIVLARHFRKLTTENDRLESWQDAAVILIVLASITWGSLAFIFGFHWPAFHQLVVITVLLIIALGAMPAYATILPIYILSLTAVLLPLFVIFLLSDVSNFPLYAAGLGAFWIILFSISKRYHDSVILELGKNRDYVDDHQEHLSSNDV